MNLLSSIIIFLSKVNFIKKNTFFNEKKTTQSLTNTENNNLLNFYNRRKIKELLKDGDRSEILREIVHTSFFKEKSDFISFMKEIKKNNFIVINEVVYYDTDFKFCIEFMRKDKTDEMCIENLTNTLYDISKKYNGYYNSWHTVPIKSLENG